MTLNWWAIVVAAIVGWLLGWAWYSVLFGKQWMALTGHCPDKGSKSDGMKAMLWGFLATLVMNVVLAYVISLIPNLTIACGATAGALLWLGFIATTMIGIVLYERKPIKLFAINSGYYLVALIIGGLIIASWPAANQQHALGSCYKNADGAVICTN